MPTIAHYCRIASHSPLLPNYCSRLPTTTYYWLLQLNIAYFCLLLPTDVCYCLPLPTGLLLLAIAYYCLLLPTTAEYSPLPTIAY